MGQILNSDAELRTRAKDFFDIACSAVCDSQEQFKTLFSLGQFKLLNGIVFEVTDAVREAERLLVLRYTKLLGPKRGNEKEISALAWERVCQSVVGENPSSNVDAIVKKFADDISKHVQLHFQYVAPNHAIRFQESVRKIVIGAVEAIVTDDLITGQLKDKNGPNWKITVGPESGMSFSPAGVTFQLPPVSWIVTMDSAQGNVEEEAAWLINIAISLLRLSYPHGNYYLFPQLGDRETMPVVRSEVTKHGLTITSSGISADGSSMPYLYHINDNVLAMTATDKFQGRAEAVFNPSKGSLAERFSQGLGWLTRGRQTDDRAERFLFFFTAIEALLSSDDKTAPVTQTIARYTAVILSDEAEKRVEIAGNIKSLYNARSALVHAGKRGVSRSEVNTAEYIVEALYTRVMNSVSLTLTYQKFQQSLLAASFGLPWPPSCH